MKATKYGYIRYYLVDYKGTYFTPREVECAYILMQGFTAREIAKMMMISHRTVEDYINRLKYKLNACTQVDLISKLSCCRFINIL